MIWGVALGMRCCFAGVAGETAAHAKRQEVTKKRVA
jgi:hypothetical protein